MPKPSEWVRGVAEIIERFTPRWAIAGALAAEEYRLSERLTSDADLYAEWHEGLVPALEAAGYEVRQLTDSKVGHPHLLECSRGVERIDILFPTVAIKSLLSTEQPITGLRWKT